MDFILSILRRALGKLFGKPQGPSQEAIQAKEAGATESALQTEKVSNETVLKAATASNDAVRATVTDDGLREYEANDPFNRDR